MKLIYSGTHKLLKEELGKILHHGKWEKISDIQWQCKVLNGGILNYYNTTGTVFTQGPEEKRERLMQDLVDHAAEDHLSNPESHWIIVRE